MIRAKNSSHTAIKSGETKLALLNVLEDLEEAKTVIQTQKAKDEAILSSIADAVIACDDNGIIELFNKTAEQLTGVPQKKAIGTHYRTVIRIVNETNGKPSPDIVSDSLRNKRIAILPQFGLLIRKDGLRIPVTESAAPIVGADKTAKGSVVVLHDMTREREIDKLKSEFVSIASHQLRTPLTTINWVSESLLDLASEKLTDTQREEVNEIHAASKRMVNLIDALLNVSRLEMGSVAVEPESVNIIQIAKLSINEFLPKIVKMHLQVDELYDDTITSIHTDPKLLKIILQNLLSNAIKYSHTGGKIMLKFKKERDNLIISVADTGIGIPRAQQKMIFTKLFRADNAQAVDTDGTGLGLYIVRAVTESLGGTISFTSEEGKGSVFSVVLPLSGLLKKTGTKQVVSTVT